MDVGFGTALLFAGGLLAAAALLSGLMRGTVLSIAVLSVAAGLVLAEVDAIHVYAGDKAVIHLFELALIVTLLSDGLFVDRELLIIHWGPVARALVIAMPLTLVLLALAAKLLFSSLSWPEAFLLGSVLCRDRPRRHLGRSSPPSACRPWSGMRSIWNRASTTGWPCPSSSSSSSSPLPGGDAGPEAAKLAGEAAFGALIGVVLGQARGSAHPSSCPAAGSSGAMRGSTRSGSGCSPTGSRTSPSATG